MRVSLLDIAERCQVSRATVSLVLQDSTRVSAPTKLRVREAMADMGYVYDRRAANLRGRRTFGLGLVLTDVHNPALADLAMSIEDRAGDAGCSVMMGYSRDDLARQTRILRAMMEYRVDGIVLSPAQGTTSSDLRQLADCGIPVVQVTRRVEGLVTDYAGPNNVMAGRLLADHLADLGVERVAFLGGSPGVSARRERIRGLREQWKRRGGTWHPELALASNALESGGTIAVGELLRTVDVIDRPDALVAYSDVVAAGVVSALREAGIEPGADVAVAGIDDSPGARHVHPNLTSVDTAMVDVGSEAVRLLLARVEEPGRDTTTTFVRCRLEVRASTSAWSRD